MVKIPDGIPVKPVEEKKKGTKDSWPEVRVEQIWKVLEEKTQTFKNESFYHKVAHFQPNSSSRRECFTGWLYKGCQEHWERIRDTTGNVSDSQFAPLNWETWKGFISC